MLSQAIENPRQHLGSEIQIDDTGESLVYEKLTILSERDDSPLLRELTVAIPPRARVLVTGREGQEHAFFRATAGLVYPGSGRIFRPANEGIRFLPQQPYLPPSTLRQLIVPSAASAENPDERISKLLADFGLERISTVEGFQQEVEWDTLLTPREQQLLAMASVSVARPRVIVLERTEATVGSDELRAIMTRFAEDGIACVHIGNASEISFYDAILEFADDGAWQWRKRA